MRPPSPDFCRTGTWTWMQPNWCERGEWVYLHEGMVDTFLGGPRTPFEQLRRITLSQLFSRVGIDHGRDDIEDLLGNRVTPTLFPDVVEALTELRDRYTLSVLSNGDLAVLQHIVATLNIPVHRTISVEQAACYKPDQRVYRKATELLSCGCGEHAARSRPRLGCPSGSGSRNERRLH